MAIVDFILNLAGLLLWLNWRSNRFDPLVKRMPATLMGTLRPAAPKKLRRWHFLVFIAILLAFRAVIYWWIGGMFPRVWVGELNFGLTMLPFRSDLLLRMLIFSFLSFGLVLWVYYVWLLMFSILAGPMPIHALVTIPLGRVDRWPNWVKVLIPFIITATFWALASWLFIRMNILTPISPAGRFQQSIVLGLSSYLLWKVPLILILLLYLLNSYIYFGRHPLWSYVSTTAQTILRPVQKIPLRIGKVNLAPILGIALVFVVSHFAEKWLGRLYNHLPL